MRREWFGIAGAFAAGLVAVLAARRSDASVRPADSGGAAAPDLLALDVGAVPALQFLPVQPDAIGEGASVIPQEPELLRRWALPAEGAPYADLIEAAAARHGVPPELLGRVLYQESRFRPDIIEGRRRSSAGALGIAQFMPATAAERGVDPLQPSSAIPGAARYLRELRDRFGSWAGALAAYNWGQGNLQRKGFDRAPPETRAYVAEILADVGLA